MDTRAHRDDDPQIYLLVGREQIRLTPPEDDMPAATASDDTATRHLHGTETPTTPTGLKPVLAVIPEHCYERSTIRGLGLFLRDVIIFALATWGLLSTNNPLLLVPLWLLSGVMVAGLFVIGHDAAHSALFDSKRLNAVVARVSMLPSLHAVEVWVFGHNRVHHGHTLRQGMDFVWHPLTVEQYEELGRFAQLRHRLEWGPFGAGAYYLREVWWNKMVRFTP
ncbi:MAG: fatty acid desaturase, partial [Ilumatobacteraceae bacterium]